MATRQPKGRPTIYQGSDGLFHSWPEDGTYPDGRTKRKHIKRKTADEVKDALDEHAERQKKGQIQTARVVTLEQWLEHWVHVVLLAKRDAGTLAWGTWQDYESICRNHLIPFLGHWRVKGSHRRLEPEHVEAMYARLKGEPPIGLGLAGSYVARMHSVLTQALKMAFRRGPADRNVMDLIDRPTYRKRKIKPPSYSQARLLVAEVLRDSRAYRWLLGMVAGPRQGEVLGIRWTSVILDPSLPDVPHILMLKQIKRRSWQHGCDDPVACNKTRTKERSDGTVIPYNPCNRKMCGKLYLHGCGDTCGKKLARACPSRTSGAGCFRHRTKDGLPKPCPRPCAEDCTEHASTCPSRKGGGLVEADLKTHASEEPLALGALLTELLRAERERQIKDGTYRPDGYIVPGTAPGQPMDPREDYEQWCEIERRAGVEHGRLHAGTRHLTGTLLSATGADLPLIRDILRQADTSIAAGYVANAMEARQGAIDRVTAALVDGDISMILGAKRVA